MKAKTQNNIKLGFVFLMIGVMFLPNIQRSLHLFKLKELNGAFIIKEEPTLDIRNYFDSSFQNEYNQYFEENLGFREILIRLYNSYTYLLFKKSNVSDVVVGKDDYLFNPRYIDAITGKSFIGEETIDKNVDRIKRLQDSLKNNGKLLIVVFAPGKASYYNEYIPEHLKRQVNKTNYDLYKEKFNKSGVNFIDMKSYFIEKKAIAKYPLFTKLGTHWTLEGANIAVDSINNYIVNNLSFNLPSKNYLSYEKQTQKNEVDYDLEILMNLNHDLSIQENIYKPIVSFDTSTIFKKPNVLVVSDSYYWNIYGTTSPDNQYNDYIYYFYFNTAYYNKCQQSSPRNSTDVKKEMDKADVFILMCTEANDYYFPFGFTDYALATFEPEFKNLPIDERLFFIKKWEIKNNKEWMKQIEDKAKENNISVEEQLNRDTNWALKN